MSAIEPLREAAHTGQDAASHRHAWIDNLRVVIITGVIGAHVALIYALDVGWYYEERTASTVAKATLAAVFSPGLLFGMGLMFFLAGMVTPRALTAKGPRRFVIDRVWRLGIPLIAYLLFVNPAMNFYGDQAMGRGEAVGDYFRDTYRHDIELGVAWFIAALLLFSVAFATWRSRHQVLPNGTRSLRRDDLIRAAAFIAAASFAVRLIWPFLSTGELAGLNLWEYPQMLTLFVLGVLAAEHHWFDEGLSSALRRSCQRAAVSSVLATMILAVGITVTDDADPFLGGLHIQAIVIPIIEATIAVSMSLWVTDWFRRRWTRSTPIVHGAGRASFGAYLLHPPLTVLLAALLRDVGVPAELKFLVVFAIAGAAAFALGWFLTRARVATRIL